MDNAERIICLKETLEYAQERIESLTKERDEWEDQANAQCIRNDKLQDEYAKLKAQINEVKR